ncbi:uncharacterized protein LOC109606611 [Aethina tumida]|uniref:uncharacterized protein LOC109606611 n=1 Tax=Aethina tumida TaxID=116153 RepID=UPI0021499009|nr:uncharacterized protein LOC109606611 [Aethina tumida]
MADNPDRAATSEVGSESRFESGSGSGSGGSEVKWESLLEQQNRNFLALLQALRPPSNQVSVELPEFDPDTENADAQAWISTADMCISDKSMSGAPLIILLSKALRGQASSWLSKVTYPEMTWSEFKDIFASRYHCPETTATVFLNFLNNKPKDDECLASYAARQMTSLMTRCSNLTREEILASAVLAHIASFEPRTRRLAITSDIDTRAKLLKELTVFFLYEKEINDERLRPQPQ